MYEQHWPLVETVARELAERRVEPDLIQAVTGYLVAHREADDFFALLDDLAGPAGQALDPTAARAGRFAALRASCQPLRTAPAETLPELMGWAARLARYHLALLPPPARAPAPPPPAPAAAPAAAPPPSRPTPAPAAPARAPAAAPRPPRPPAAPRPPAPPREPRPAPAPPTRPAPAGQPPEPARPAAQRRQSMADLLEALRAQFNAQRVTGAPVPQPRLDRAESQRERLRREQQAIQERYRRQQESAREEP
jgi:hypothetical protein